MQGPISPKKDKDNSKQWEKLPLALHTHKLCWSVSNLFFNSSSIPPDDAILPLLHSDRRVAAAAVQTTLFNYFFCTVPTCVNHQKKG